MLVAAVGLIGCGGGLNEDLTSRCRVTEQGLRAKHAGDGAENQGDSVGEIYRTSSGCHHLDEEVRDEPSPKAGSE